MSFVSVFGDWIAVASGTKVLIFSDRDSQQITLEVPPTRPQENKPAAKKAPGTAQPENAKLAAVGLRFSPCGRWLAAYSSGKQLLVWETSGWSLCSDRDIPKTASSLSFTCDSRAVIIVDKAGDALQFSMTDLQLAGEVILGHLSMLLDVVLSRDGKFIITCDRDEKIRVSCFPNAYNIVSYCLGHKEFVSSICLLPHNESFLLSASGDETLRLWKYCSGAPLANYNYSSDVKKELPIDSSCFAEKEIDNQSSVIVKKICCHKVDDNLSLVCVVFYGYQGCLIYHIIGTDIQFLQALSSKYVVLDTCFKSSGELIILVKNEGNDILHCFSFDSARNTLTSSNTSASEEVRRINEVLRSMNDQCASSSNIPHLVKRKFDNVKDYYEQKKARIGGH